MTRKILIFVFLFLVGLIGVIAFAKTWFPKYGHTYVLNVEKSNVQYAVKSVLFDSYKEINFSKIDILDAIIVHGKDSTLFFRFSITPEYYFQSNLSTLNSPQTSIFYKKNGKKNIPWFEEMNKGIRIGSYVNNEKFLQIAFSRTKNVNIIGYASKDAPFGNFFWNDIDLKKDIKKH